MASSVHTLRPFSAAALVATGVGTWDYDVGADRYTLDPVAAALFGFSRDAGAAGISAAQLYAAVDPVDVERGDRGAAAQRPDENLYVADFRLKGPGPERRVLVRGRLVRDAATGQVTHRRGVAVDVTVVRREGFDDASANPLPKSPVTPLGLAVDAALDAHTAITAMGTSARTSLLPIVELLLYELGKQTEAEE